MGFCSRHHEHQRRMMSPPVPPHQLHCFCGKLQKRTEVYRSCRARIRARIRINDACHDRMLCISTIWKEQNARSVCAAKPSRAPEHILRSASHAAALVEELASHGWLGTHRALVDCLARPARGRFDDMIVICEPSAGCLTPRAASS